MPAPPPTGRRLARLLWPAMIAWAALVAVRAAAELAQDDVVPGLTRTWHPPYRAPLGDVIDPRPVPALLAEIRDRYAPHVTTEAPPDPTEPAAWPAALAALGLRAEPFIADRWTGAPPRLRVPPKGPPLLLIGLLGVDPIAVVPGLGVVRVPEGALPPAALDLALVGAREEPW